MTSRKFAFELSYPSRQASQHHSASRRLHPSDVGSRCTRGTVGPNSPEIPGRRLYDA